MNGEIAARNGDVDGVGLGFDETQIVGADGAGEEDEGFWANVSV